VVITVKHLWRLLVGVRNSDSLSITSKKERFKTLFVCRFGPEVTGDDVEKPLKKQLNLQKLGCIRLETKFSTYASSHVWVIEDGFWPAGCLILLFMVSSPLIRCTPQVLPSLETQISPTVVFGSAEVALIPPNNDFEPQQFRYFLSKCQGT
jgi:hypothetical protein